MRAACGIGIIRTVATNGTSRLKGRTKGVESKGLSLEKRPQGMGGSLTWLLRVGLGVAGRVRRVRTQKAHGQQPPEETGGWRQADRAEGKDNTLALQDGSQPIRTETRGKDRGLGEQHRGMDRGPSTA